MMDGATNVTTLQSACELCNDGGHDTTAIALCGMCELHGNGGRQRDKCRIAVRGIATRDVTVRGITTHDTKRMPLCKSCHCDSWHYESGDLQLVMLHIVGLQLATL